MTLLRGIAASGGIAMGRAFLLVEPELSVTKKSILNPNNEIARFHAAVNTVKQQLQIIRDRTETELGEVNAAIFDAHLLVLSDPEIIETVENQVNAGVNAEFALQETSLSLIEIFEQLDDEYLRERVADIKDVTKQVLAELLHVEIPNINLITEEVIIITKDLAPSETVQLNPVFAKGFITDLGGRTSHSAIMARSMGIPAIVGTTTATKIVQNGDFIILNGDSGEIFINPTQELIDHYKEKKAKFEVQMKALERLKNKPTITVDGIRIEIAANIGTPQEVMQVLENGAEGIGLYRTEFLYMERDSLPTEEEQFEAYKTVLEKMEGKPVVIRTLDIGGDKQLPYLHLPEELNPFLGLRAIRLCLQQQDLFRTQLRALLRASCFGNLKIMFPMIATIEEFREAKQLLLEEKKKLQEHGIPVAGTFEIGIMVEIPSTAILANQFAKEVDFFSIGTNDLIQYTFAADRMNEHVSYLYQPYNPAILRLIKMVIDAAHVQGKWVGMCGEMAGDAIAIPLLIGLGLDEFSMSVSSTLKARDQINQLKQSEMKELAKIALSMESSEQVMHYVLNEI
ncbi:phosphoenolpyruvate--protein phosphotransferase [Lysinibacillus sp. 2017]|uniref:phosphoenolpyruvate--protein phosphotransferase n=1 Tax=unclassified Lysinibacillus TaxID=2636778 RepID=UPI000D52A099|nr:MULTISPECIES: phosphoenolpyruvate--protein phosphotransferase [unclassified Lysinibacillus]AWE07134.1 phosphoenolpyruvate--protein phosphotransferase [Lysinibacillus sp. 2017]TGN36946.1 phosphoenolpyruvate--protein phosphotransferase [Lysinibacillus sp. S2017]